MTARDERTRRMYAALPVEERVRMALSASNDGAQFETFVVRTMPAAQVDDFNRLMRIAERARRLMGIRVISLGSRVDSLEHLNRVTLTLAMWASDRLSLTYRLLLLLIKEPIPESQHEELLRVARAEFLSLDEAVRMVVEEHGTDESGVRAELVSLCESGEIECRSQEAGIEIESGSLHDWLGEPVPVAFEWAPQYEIVPDASWGQEEQNRLEILRQVEGDLASGPLSLAPPQAGFGNRPREASGTRISGSGPLP